MEALSGRLPRAANRTTKRLGPIRGKKGEIMADDSSLVAFLDRAEEVSMLASKLGFAFQQEVERQRESGWIDPASWDRHKPAFDQYCQALLDLAREIQNPPDGSGAVGDELKRAAKIAREIRDGMKVDDYRCFAEYLACFPGLNSVAWDLHSAIKHVRKTLDAVDPFGFLDGARPQLVACQDEPPLGAGARVVCELSGTARQLGVRIGWHALDGAAGVGMFCARHMLTRRFAS
jgi:hypothetical protein